MAGGRVEIDGVTEPAEHGAEHLHDDGPTGRLHVLHLPGLARSADRRRLRPLRHLHHSAVHAAQLARQLLQVATDCRLLFTRL